MTVEEVEKAIEAVRIPDSRLATAQLQVVLLELLALAGSKAAGVAGGVSAELMATLQGCVEVVQQQAGQLAALAEEVAELRERLEPAEDAAAEADPELVRTPVDFVG